MFSNCVSFDGFFDSVVAGVSNSAVFVFFAIGKIPFWVRGS
jgi:hypothetical protein